MKAARSLRQMVSTLSEDELQEMLRGDYLRRLARYKLIDESLREKYGMSFEEFERENIVTRKNFSWEVESDAQEWELAHDGIKTCGERLGKIHIGH